MSSREHRSSRTLDQNSLPLSHFRVFRKCRNSNTTFRPSLLLRSSRLIFCWLTHEVFTERISNYLEMLVTSHCCFEWSCHFVNYDFVSSLWQYDVLLSSVKIIWRLVSQLRTYFSISSPKNGRQKTSFDGLDAYPLIGILEFAYFWFHFSVVLIKFFTHLISCSCFWSRIVYSLDTAELGNMTIDSRFWWSVNALTWSSLAIGLNAAMCNTRLRYFRLRRHHQKT